MDRIDSVVVVDHEGIQRMMDAGPPSNYDNYQLQEDVAVDCIMQMMHWQTQPEKETDIWTLTQMAVEACAVANGYAHHPDHRASANVDVGRGVFHAFSLGFGNVAGLWYPEMNDEGWLFAGGKEWNDWMLNVFVKAAFILVVLRYTAGLPYSVYKDVVNYPFAPSPERRPFRVELAHQVCAVAVTLAPRFWRGGLGRHQDRDELAARIQAINGGSSPGYVTRNEDNRWLFEPTVFKDEMGARRFATLIDYLRRSNPAFDLCL